MTNEDAVAKLHETCVKLAGKQITPAQQAVLDAAVAWLGNGTMRAVKLANAVRAMLAEKEAEHGNADN